MVATSIGAEEKREIIVLTKSCNFFLSFYVLVELTVMKLSASYQMNNNRKNSVFCLHELQFNGKLFLIWKLWKMAGLLSEH